MTGFGRGEHISFERKFKVEIKAVNHRYCDITIKMPRFLNSIEDRLRRRLAQDITRGKVDVWIHFESFAQKDVAVNVNTSLADAYIETLAGLSSRYGFGTLEAHTAMELLAANSDIITIDKFGAALSSDAEQEAIWETLHQALENALLQFNKMRTAEGNAMAEDISNKQMLAQEIVASLVRCAPQVVEENAAKLRERLADMLQKSEHIPDETRLATEVAIIADKGCISEEIARLQSHMAQLETMLQEKDAIGRKLDFLIQELNREANTIGSKSVDAGVTAQVIELKSLIEKMREQVQNIE